VTASKTPTAVKLTKVPTATATTGKTVTATTGKTATPVKLVKVATATGSKKTVQPTLHPNVPTTSTDKAASFFSDKLIVMQHIAKPILTVK
jgi:hypothetical protein